MKTAALLLSFLLPLSIQAGTQPGKKYPPGSWQPANPDTNAEAAARFAIEQKSRESATPITLVSIVSLERQVVAGLNYKLRLAVTENSKVREALATVWQKPDGSLTLTAWDWL